MPSRPPLRRPPSRRPPVANRLIRPRAAARLYIVLGVLAFAGSAALAVWPGALLRGAAVADATVVALRGNAQDGWTPVIQFTARNGGVVRWSGGRGPAPTAVGARLRVIYLPDNPGVVAIAGFWRLYGPAVATGVFGCVFMVLGLLGWHATRPAASVRPP